MAWSSAPAACCSDCRSVTFARRLYNRLGLLQCHFVTMPGWIRPSSHDQHLPQLSKVQKLVASVAELPLPMVTSQPGLSPCRYCCCALPLPLYNLPAHCETALVEGEEKLLGGGYLREGDTKPFTTPTPAVLPQSTQLWLSTTSQNSKEHTKAKVPKSTSLTTRNCAPSLAVLRFVKTAAASSAINSQHMTCVLPGHHVVQLAHGQSVYLPPTLLDFWVKSAPASQAFSCSMAGTGCRRMPMQRQTGRPQ
jgi:hypothetical protein